MFRSDLIAGLTVGTILIPQAMAYALLAGMPPIYGLYASIVPLLIYALFATSTKLSVGPVAVSALLILAGISKLATPGSSEYISYVILAGLLIGLLQVLLGLLRMGFLVNFLSHPVIAGFTSAAALIIVISQLKDAFGLTMENAADSMTTLIEVIRNMDTLNVVTAVICIASLVMVTGMKKISRKIPGPLVIVVGSIIASYYFDFEAKGVNIIGAIPEGLPSFIMPTITKADLIILWPTILTVTLIGIVESLGIAKSLESKHKDHTVVADKELIALGLAKIVGAFFQSLPTSGSFSRSAINSDNGAKTTVASIVAVVMVAITLMFFTSFFYYLPKAVLAAIILMSVIKLFDIKEAKYLWRVNRLDFVMMMVTFICTLLMGIEPGVACGVVLSILAVIYKNAVPRMSELGQIEGTEYYKSIERYDNALSVPDVIILRFENEIFFGNSSLFKEQVNLKVAEHPGVLKHVILDGSLIYNIDSTGLHMLKDLDDNLKHRAIDLHMTGAIGTLRDSLYKAGLLGEADKHHITVHAAVLHTQSGTAKELTTRPANPLQTNEN